MFTAYPTTGASLWEPLIYTYETGDKSDIEVSVHNCTEDSEAWVKRLYNTQNATFNLAPMYRLSAMPSPYMRENQIYEAEGGFVKLKASCSGESTPESIFTLAKSVINCGDLITTLPLSRLISPGERDTIRLFTNPNDKVQAILETANEGEGSYFQMHEYSKKHDGLIDVVIEAPSEISTIGEELTLTIYTESSGMHCLQYFIARSYQTGESMRLAWLSSAGSIEHHTFPIIKDIEHHRDGSNSYTVVSAYAGEAYIAAIAEIVSSPMVWRLDNLEYKQIEVESDIAPIKNIGSLCYLELKVVENG